MKKLLFGISETEECRRAVKTIISLFGGQHIDLTLLHVTPDTIIHAESGLIDYELIAGSDNAESLKILDSFYQAFKNENFVCHKVLKSGNPIDVVLEMAPKFDLLIIGASESSLLYRIFSSHQNSFVNASPIPVLVAK